MNKQQIEAVLREIIEELGISTESTMAQNLFEYADFDNSGWGQIQKLIYVVGRQGIEVCGITVEQYEALKQRIATHAGPYPSWMNRWSANR